MKTKHTHFKLGAIGLFALLSSTVVALDKAKIEFASQAVASSKAVEVQAVATKLVLDAPPGDQERMAVAVVTSVIRSHNGAFPAVIGSVTKAVPATTSAVVKAALDAAPGSSLAIVSAAAKGAPVEAGKTIAIASRSQPSLAAAFEREVAVMRGNDLIRDVKKDAGSKINASGHAPRPPYANCYAHPGDEHHGRDGDDHGRDDDDHGRGKDGDHGRDGDDHGRAGDNHGHPPTFPKKP